MTRWLSFRMAFEHVRLDFRRMALGVLAVVPAGLGWRSRGCARATHNVSFAAMHSDRTRVLCDRLVHDVSTPTAPRGHRPLLGGRDP
jgi:hypothetical protein